MYTRFPKNHIEFSVFKMSDPAIRHSTKEAIDFIAKRLGIKNDHRMQDWEFEVAEAADLDKYLALFSEVSEHDNLRFTLASMIIQAFEDDVVDLDVDQSWKAFVSDLSQNTELHAYQIWYWACWDVELAKAWRVTPYMRALWTLKNR